jgi:hypothetical protein
MSGCPILAASGGSPVVTGILFVAAPSWLVVRSICRMRLHRAAAEGRSPAEDEDPGWDQAVARIPSAFPDRRAKEADPLTVLRMIFLGLEIALFLWLLVLSFATPWNSGDVGLAPWIVAAAGLLSLAGVAWLRRRPLHTGSEAGLAAQFRTAMLLGIAFAEIAWLIAVVTTFIAQSLWIYVLGLVFAVLGMTLVAPRRAEIARRQRQIDEAHQGYDLTRSLLHAPDRPRRD